MSDKSTEKSAGQRLSENFRHAARLPERTSDEPTDPAEISELDRQQEPEGGYGNPDAEDEAPAKKKGAKK